MKRTHRRVHAVVWLLLLPMLLGFVYLASHSISTGLPTMQSAPHASDAGELP